MHLGSVHKVRASFLEGSLPGCTVGTGCMRLLVQERTGLPSDRLDRLVEEGNKCRQGTELEVDRSQQCRVAEVCNHGHTRRVCTARCINRHVLQLG